MENTGKLNINLDVAISKIYSIFLLIYTLLLMLHNTFLGFHIQTFFSKSECIVGAILAILLATKLASIDNNHRREWFKANLLIFVYFAIRTITLIKTGFDYSTIRCIFFEGVYLLVLTDLLLSGKFVKKILIPVTISVIFLINLINAYLYFYYINTMAVGEGGGVAFNFIVNYSGYASASNFYYSLMYINPNWFGMMTALSIVLAVILISKNNKQITNILLIGYIIFSFYCVWLSTCRSAMIALAIVLAVFLLSKGIKKFSKEKVLIVCLAGVILIMSVIVGFIISNDETGMTYGYTNKEQILDTYGSGRYTIWKECYYADKDEILLGQGSISRELELRNQFFNERFEETGYEPINLRPHNGYIGQLVISGLIGFIIFISVIYQKIHKSQYVREENWYFVIILILVINIFECMFTLGINILCLYMFMILSMRKDLETKKDVLNQVSV